MKKNKSGAGRPIAFWTKERIKILKTLYPKEGNESIAATLGTTVSAIRNKAVILRLKKDGRYWDKPEEDFVKKTSLSIEEIAKKLKKTKWAVYGKRRELMNKNPR